MKTNKKLSFGELKELVFRKNRATKQNKYKLFKLAKAEKDIVSIEKLRDDFDFKSAKTYLKKLNTISIEDILETRDFEMLKIIIDRKANLSKVNIGKLIVKNYDIEFIKLIIENGADINADDEKGNTPLMFACLMQKKAIVKLLINNKVEINSQAYYGDTALKLSCQDNNQDIVELLIRNGANVNIVNYSQESALMTAVNNEQFSIVKLLINSGCDLDLQNNHNITALMLASQDGYLNIVELLVENKVDLDLQEDEGFTALMMALSKEEIHQDVIKFLTNAGANLEIQNKRGATVLMLASQINNLTITKLLLDNKADANVISNGVNALMISCVENNEQVALLLIKYTEDLDIQTIDGNSALLYAVNNNMYDVAKSLLSGGVNPNVSNNNGDTPILTALYKSDFEIIELLLKYDIQIEATTYEKPNDIDEETFIKRSKTIESVPQYFDRLNEKISSREVAEQFIAYFFNIFNEEKILQKFIQDAEINLNLINNKSEKHATKVNELSHMFFDILDSEDPLAMKHLTTHIFDMILNEYELGIYSKDKFTDLKYNKYDDSYKHKFILKDQIDGKAMIHVYEQKLIFHFINKKGKRTSREYKLIKENKYYDKRTGYILIIKNKLIEIAINGGVRISEFVMKDEFDNIINDKKHNPKRLVEILNLFTQDNPIKYTAHSFEWSRYGSYENFINEVKKAFNIVEDDLSVLSPNLHTKINKFLFDSTLNNENAWGINKLRFGWSSPELKEWCSMEDSKPKGKKAIDYPLPKEYQNEVNHKTLTTFLNVCDVFKNEIEIRDDDKLSALFDDLEEEVLGFDFDFKVELINLDSITFYTDVENLRNGLAIIFGQFKEDGREKYNNITVEAIPDSQDKNNIKYIDIKIIQKGSEVSKTCDEMKKEIENGSFQDIKNHFTSLCDWRIEAKFTDGNFRVDYLTMDTENSKPKQLDFKPEGFTHKLRFYK